MKLHDFPDFDYELPAIPGFVANTWHNDACPRLDGPCHLTVWCDYADPTLRETGLGGKRFTLVHGPYGDPDAETLLESDDIAAIVAEINRVLTEI